MRNDAERTSVIAAFGDLDVGTVRRRRAHAARMFIVQVADVIHKAGPFAPIRRFDGFPYPVPRARAQQGVDFRHLLQQLFLILLAEAARHDQQAAFACLFIFGGLQNCIDRFFLRLFNKGTCIDDDNIGFGQIVGNFHMFIAENAQHYFRIDEVFRAAQADESNFFHLRLLSEADRLDPPILQGPAAFGRILFFHGEQRQAVPFRIQYVLSRIAGIGQIDVASAQDAVYVV